MTKAEPGADIPEQRALELEGSAKVKVGWGQGALDQLRARFFKACLILQTSSPIEFTSRYDR